MNFLMIVVMNCMTFCTAGLRPKPKKVGARYPSHRITRRSRATPFYH
jgi:hypothetical protein